MTEMEDVPVEKLHIDPANVLPKPDVDVWLRDNIWNRGILEPLLVRPHDGEYGVIIGSRRLVAARSAGLDEVPCVIRADLEGNDAKVDELSLLPYTTQKPLPIHCKVRFVLERYEETDGRKTRGKRVKKVAEELCISRSQVYAYLRIGNLDRSLRARLKEPSKRSEGEKKLLNKSVEGKSSDLRKISMSVASELGDSSFFLKIQKKDLKTAHELASEAAEKGQNETGDLLVKWKKKLSNGAKGGEK